MKKLIILINILFVFLISCSTNQSQNNNELISEFAAMNIIKDTSQLNQLALKYFLEGTKLHNQKKYKDAVIEYLEALRLDSSYAVHYAIAKSFRELRRYDLAEHHLLIALKKKSDLIDALELLAEIQFLQGFSNNDENLKKAIATMKKVVELNPSEKNRFMLARIYEYVDTDKATKHYLDLLDDYKDTKILTRLLSIYDYNQDFEKYYQLKVEHKERLLNSPTDFYEILTYNYIKLNTELNKDILDYSLEKLNYEELSELFTNFIIYILENKNESYKYHAKMLIDLNSTAFNTYAPIQYAYGILYFSLDEFAKADKYFTKAIKLAQSPVNMYNQIAFFYYANQKYDNALEYLLQSIDKEKDINNLIFISQIYSANMSNYEEALNYAHKAYNADSTNIDVLGNIANIHNYLKNYQKSDEFFERALKIDSTDAFINNNYAYSLAERKKDLEKAIKMSKIAIEKEPNNSAYLDTYGWILFQKGEYHNARIYLEEAVKKNNLGSEVFEHLGDIYIELDYFNKALDAYYKALEFDVNNEEIINKIKNIENKNMLKD